MTLVRSRLALSLLLFATEFVVLAVAYQFVADLECSATASVELCAFLGGFIARGIALAAGLLIVLAARPAAGRALLLAIDLESGRRGWLALHVLGVALLFLPLVASAGPLSASFDQALLPWVAGGLAAAVGALLWLAPPAVLLDWLRDLGWPPAAALGIAFLLPDIARRAQPIWDLSGPARATFDAVLAVLRVAGADPAAWPEAHVIGIGAFRVEVARACSGVEGLALVLGLATLYALLFRTGLRPARFWLVVVPACLLASWCLNVLRIATLIAIGAHLSPEFAVNGFHSYAGWLLFTLLAVAMLFSAHAIPWLHRDSGATPAVRWRSDRSVGCILPFAALMAADVVVAASFPRPALGYAVKIGAAVAALHLMRAAYRGLRTTPDGVALASGLLVGLGWVASRPPATEADVAALAAVAGLAGLPWLAWATARLAGTVLVVPLVEELFFRGYLLDRLDRGGSAARLAAILVSSALFGALHDRWLIAFLAGVVFALVYLRRGRLSDAIAAHVAANLVVAGWAAAMHDWTAI